MNFVMKLILEIKLTSENVNDFPLSHSPNPLISVDHFTFCTLDNKRSEYYV